MQRSVVIVGGGMSGMSAALQLADQARVTILERQERIGRKLLLTGNGRCNISNRNIRCTDYVTGSPERLEELFRQVSSDEIYAFLQELGIQLTEKNGGLYPFSRQASSVLDAFRFALADRGVEIVTDTLVERVEKKGKRYVLKPSGITVDYVILGCGGLAGVYHEDKQNGYDIAKALGHSVTPLYPALTATVCEGDFGMIAGVRTEADICLKKNASVLATESGELQLTKNALSGIPVFQLSRFIRDTKKDSYTLTVDFLPFLEEQGYEAFSVRREAFAGRKPELYFSGWLNQKLSGWLVKKAGIKEETIGRLTDKQLKMLYRLARECVFPVLSVKDYREAQVSSGGVPLTEIKPQMESVYADGVYLCGEMLDVCGACGGYNLHFAMLSGLNAAKDIQKRLQTLA